MDNLAEDMLAFICYNNNDNNNNNAWKVEHAAPIDK